MSLFTLFRIIWLFPREFYKRNFSNNLIFNAIFKTCLKTLMIYYVLIALCNTINLSPDVALTLLYLTWECLVTFRVRNKWRKNYGREPILMMKKEERWVRYLICFYTNSRFYDPIKLSIKLFYCRVVNFLNGIIKRKNHLDKFILNIYEVRSIVII